MVVAAEKFRLDVVANLVDKLNFEEWFAADEVPNHRFVSEIGVGLMVEHIVDEGLGHLPRHAFLHIFAYKIAIFAGQLAVLGDDEGDVFRHTALPGSLIIFNSNH